MTESIILPVPYLGTTHEFPLELVTLGYTYQLHILVEGRTLIFEKDEDREYRVIDASGDANHIDKALINAIISTLDSL